jgi:hypothetical protein
MDNLQIMTNTSDWVKPPELAVTLATETDTAWLFSMTDRKYHLYRVYHKSDGVSDKESLERLIDAAQLLLAKL